MLTPSPSIPEPAFVVSADGYIRLTSRQIQAIRLEHLISNLDQHTPADGDTRATQITGYAEWQTCSQPAITVGWDWQIGIGTQGVEIQLINMPRSNIMLVDDHDQRLDLGQDKTALWLKKTFSTMSWQPAVRACLEARGAIHAD